LVLLFVVRQTEAAVSPRSPPPGGDANGPAINFPDGTVHATSTGPPPGWCALEGSFAMLTAMNMAWAGSDIMFGPYWYAGLCEW
jgi:hypothetical protein